jgi:hypothetical protein
MTFCERARTWQVPPVQVPPVQVPLVPGLLIAAVAVSPW